jgi:HrpA-like RNA helicase
MGIFSLQSFLEENASSFKFTSLSRVSSLAFSNGTKSVILLVDGSSIAHMLADSAVAPSNFAPFPKLFGGDLNDLFIKTRAIVSAFASLGVELVIVTDGPSVREDEIHKRETKISRFQQNLTNLAKIDAYCTTSELGKVKRGGKTFFPRYDTERNIISISLTSTPFIDIPVGSEITGALRINAPDFSYSEVFSALQSCGCTFVSVYGEADEELVRMYIKMKEKYDIDPCAPFPLGILSQDSDFVGFKSCHYLPISDVYIGVSLFASAMQKQLDSAIGPIQVIKPSIASLDTDIQVSETCDIVFNVLSSSSVSSMLKIPERLMPDLAILTGNDYTLPILSSNAIVQAHYASLLFENNERNVTRVSDWLRKQLCICDKSKIDERPSIDNDDDDDDENKDNTKCTLCDKPRTVESHSRLLDLFYASSSALLTAASYTRKTYSMQTVSIKSAITSGIIPNQASTVLQKPEPVHSLTLRLLSDDWSRSVYACHVLNLLSSSLFNALEKRFEMSHAVTETITSDWRQPTSALLRRPFLAAKMALISAVSDEARVHEKLDNGPISDVFGIQQIVPNGYLANSVCVRPRSFAFFRSQVVEIEKRNIQLPDRHLFDFPFNQELDIPALGGATDLLVIRLRGLQVEQRLNAFERLLDSSLYFFDEEWISEPKPINVNELTLTQPKENDAMIDSLTEKLSTVSFQQQSLSSSTSTSSANSPLVLKCSPWVSLSKTSTDNFTQNKPEWTVYGFKGPTPSATSAMFATAMAVRHFIAFTSHLQRIHGTSGGKELPCVSMPSLPELACLVAMTCILITRIDNRLESFLNPSLLEVVDRPRLRTCSIASWFASIVNDIESTATWLDLIKSSKSETVDKQSVDEKDKDTQSEIIGTVFSNENRHHFVQAIPIPRIDYQHIDTMKLDSVSQIVNRMNTSLKKEIEPFESFDGRKIYEGRLFHFLCQNLGDFGTDLGSSDQYPVLQIDPTGRHLLSLESILHPTVKLALERFGSDQAFKYYKDVWSFILRPFDQEKIFKGYTLTTFAAKGRITTPVDIGKSLAQSLFSTSATVEKTVNSVRAVASAAAQAGHTSALPITAFKKEIVWAVARHTVSIVKGDTGSGKSSQTPQYVIDQALRTSSQASGRHYNGEWDIEIPPEIWGDSEADVYVTQPRRVAAVTLATRVADERGQKPGDEVGYRIGHDAVAGPRTRLCFCTTGWLLQWLVHADAEGRLSDQDSSDMNNNRFVDSIDIKPDIGGKVTHLILDEVHERGIDTDLVCLVIKMALTRGMQRRVRAMRLLQQLSQDCKDDPNAIQHIKEYQRQAALIFARRTRVILMSATFDTTIFYEYFAEVVASHSAQLELELRTGEFGKKLGSTMLSIPVPFFLNAPPPHQLSQPPLTAMMQQDLKKRQPPKQQKAPTTLIEAMSHDTPTTLHVGAKRYPVDVVFLDEIYTQKSLAMMPRIEQSQIARVLQESESAVQAWERDRQKQLSLGDMLMLSDFLKEALLKLAVRISLSVAKPGTGDCILIFVSGMAEIDKIVELFAEIAPGLVAAPTAKLAESSDEGLAEDADITEFEDKKTWAAKEVNRSLGEGIDSIQEEIEEDGQTHPIPSPFSSAGVSSSSLKTSVIDRSTIRLLPMHSLISFEDQMEAFNSSSTDRRTRIVIATNIAESSVTLPDVHTVIDLGRAKTVEFVPKLKASVLRASWISQASCAQRTGRSGRVCPGTSFRLVSRRFHDLVMPKYALPEMLRLTLDSVVLKIKILGIRTDAAVAQLIAEGVKANDAERLVVERRHLYPEEESVTVNSAKAILGLSIQPPDSTNVDSALEKLAALGALDSSNDISEVTPFGKILSSFPGDLALGKLVAFGAALGILPDAIVMAACLSIQDIFRTPHPSQFNSIEEMANAWTMTMRTRWLFGLDSVIGKGDAYLLPESLREAALKQPMPPTGASSANWSEPIASRNAYIAWRITKPIARPSWCVGIGLVHKKMASIHSVVKEISQRVSSVSPAHAMQVKTLLRSDNEEAKDDQYVTNAKGEPLRTSSSSAFPPWPPENLFTTDTHLLRTVLCAALIGNLVLGNSKPNKWNNLGLGPRIFKVSLPKKGDVPEELFDIKALSVRMSDIDQGSRTLSKFNEYVGPLARSFFQLGIPRTNLLEISTFPLPQSRKQELKNKNIIVELDGDWLSDAKNVEEGRYSSSYDDRKRDDLYRYPSDGVRLPIPSGPGTPFSSKIPNGALRFLGLQSKQSSSGLRNGIQSASISSTSTTRNEPIATPIRLLMRPGQLKQQKGTVMNSSSSSSSSSSSLSSSSNHPTSTFTASSATYSGSSSSVMPRDIVSRPALAYEPLAQAIPISIVALCQVANRNGEVILPLPSPFCDDLEKEKILQNKFSEITGIRPQRPIIGGTVSASARNVAANGSSLTGGQFSTGRAALPSSTTAATSRSSTYAEVSVMPAYTSNWLTCKLLDGHCAFYSYTPEEYAAKNKENEAKRVAYLVSKRSKKKSRRKDDDDDDDDDDDGAFVPDELASLKEYNASPSQASLIKYIADAPSESLQEFARILGQENLTYSPRGPLVAVCSGITLYESVRETTKTIKAQTSGMTVLWRNPRTLALSLLLFSRGSQVILEWKTSKRTKKVHVSKLTFFDEVMGNEISLKTSGLSLFDLQEVNAIRADMSKMIDNPRAAADRAVRQSGGGNSMANSRRGKEISPTDLALGAAAIVKEALGMQSRVSRLLGFAADSPASTEEEEDDDEEEEDYDDDDEDYDIYGKKDKSSSNHLVSTALIRDFFSVKDKQTRLDPTDNSVLSSLLPPFRLAATDDTITFGAPGHISTPSQRASNSKTSSKNSSSKPNPKISSKEKISVRDNLSGMKPSDRSGVSGSGSEKGGKVDFQVSYGRELAEGRYEREFSTRAGSGGASGAGGGEIRAISGSSVISSTKSPFASSATVFTPRAIPPPIPPPAPSRIYDTVDTAKAAKTRANALTLRSTETLSKATLAVRTEDEAYAKELKEVETATTKARTAVFNFETADEHQDIANLKLQVVRLWMKRKAVSESFNFRAFMKGKAHREEKIAKLEVNIAAISSRHANLAVSIAALKPEDKGKKNKKKTQTSQENIQENIKRQELILEFDQVDKLKIAAEKDLTVSKGSSNDHSSLVIQEESILKKMKEYTTNFKAIKAAMDAEKDRSAEKTLASLDAFGLKTMSLISEAVNFFKNK